MNVCPCCGFREPRIALVEPGDRYLDNILDIAEFFSGKRSFEFYKLPYFKFKDVMDQRFEKDNPPPSDKTDKPAYTRYKARRAKYFELPEARIAYAVNFCSRDGSAYQNLKERLIQRVAEDGIDINGEYEPFSTEHEFHLIQEELKDNSFTKEERDDMFTGFKKGSAAVSRILIMRVDGAEKLVPISTCSVSPYFPELEARETDEIASINQ